VCLSICSEWDDSIDDPNLILSTSMCTGSSRPQYVQLLPRPGGDSDAEPRSSPQSSRHRHLQLLVRGVQGPVLQTGEGVHSRAVHV